MTRRKSAGKETKLNRLVVFTKNPILGFAKTRIAKSVGPIKAMDIFDQLIQNCQSTCRASNLSIAVYYSNFIDPLDAWNFGVDQFIQKQVIDLGERIASAIEAELSNHQKVILIGSDCPSLTPDHLHQALELLDDADIVLGPSEDGGFYLIGLTKFDPQLFDQIEWSSASVSAQLRANVKQLNWSISELEVLNDIDEFADWQRFALRNS